MRVILYRRVKNNLRYYKIEINKTLFDEFELLRIFGNIANKNPTGIIKKYFLTIDEAQKEFKNIFDKKIKKGYFDKNLYGFKHKFVKIVNDYKHLQFGINNVKKNKIFSR